MQRWFFSLLLVLSSGSLAAHGIDGCISGNLLGGFTGYDKGNRLGINQYYFTGSSRHTNFWGEEVTDYGRSAATFVSGNFSLSKRWSLMVNTSYYVNYENMSGEVTRELGWGDSRAMVSYTFLLKIKDSTSFSRASVSGGIELPTGQVASSAVVGNFSTGSGSYDVPFSANYIFSKRNRGFKVNGFYLLNGRNHQFSYDYKYGNAAGLGFSLFKNFASPSWRYSFAVGPSLLSAANDIYEYEPEPFVIANAYIASFVQGEFAIKHGAWAVNTTLSVPVYARAEGLFDRFIWCELGLSYHLSRAH